MSNSCQKQFSLTVGPVQPTCPCSSASMTLGPQSAIDGMNYANGACPHFPNGVILNVGCCHWLQITATGPNPPCKSPNELEVIASTTGPGFVLGIVFGGGIFGGTYSQDVPSATDPRGNYTYSSGYTIPGPPPGFGAILHVTIS